MSGAPPTYSPSHAPRDETRVGAYRLAERIGIGPIAQTFRGELVEGREGQQHVCIKRVPVTAGPELEGFLKEGAAITALCHPEIARLLYFGRTDDGCYLAYELVEGVDLRSVLRVRGALGKSLTVYIATRIAMALSACHEHGLVHRDVSPGNVLLTPRGEVKLADLGVARARGRDSPTRIDMAGGKPFYAAPEYATRGQLGPLTDLYSLGVIMYECLTGERPYEGISAARVAELSAQGKRPQLQTRAPHTPLALVTLVDALLQGDPTARPRDAAEVLQALQKAEVRSDMADELRTLIAELSAQPPVAPHAAPGVPSPAAPRQPKPRAESSERPRRPIPSSSARSTTRAGHRSGTALLWLGVAVMAMGMGWLAMRMMG